MYIPSCVIKYLLKRQRSCQYFPRNFCFTKIDAIDPIPTMTFSLSVKKENS